MSSDTSEGSASLSQHDTHSPKPTPASCLYSHFKSVRRNSSHKLWEANYCSGSNASRRLLPALRLSAEILVQSCTLDFGIGRICHLTSAPICSDIIAEQTSCHCPAFNTPKHPEALFLFSSRECAWRTLRYAEEMMTVNAPRCISFANNIYIYIYCFYLALNKSGWYEQSSIPVFTLLLLYMILHNTRIAKVCESQIVPSHSLLFPSDDLWRQLA